MLLGEMSSIIGLIRGRGRFVVLAFVGRVGWGSGENGKAGCRPAETGVGGYCREESVSVSVRLLNKVVGGAESEGWTTPEPLPAVLVVVIGVDGEVLRVVSEEGLLEVEETLMKRWPGSSSRVLCLLVLLLLSLGRFEVDCFSLLSFLIGAKAVCDCDNGTRLSVDVLDACRVFVLL